MKKIPIILIVLILLTGQSFASSGYKIYVGNASGFYLPLKTVNVGLVLQATITSLTPWATYYFACTAWMESCVAPYEPLGAYCESLYSNEVSTIVGAGGVVKLAWDASPAVPVPITGGSLKNALFFNF